MFYVPAYGLYVVCSVDTENNEFYKCCFDPVGWWCCWVLLYCYGLNCVPSYQNPCVEALTHNVTVFGNRAFKEVIKVNRGHRGRALIQYDG